MENLPYESIALSALTASAPIILFLLCLTIFKMKGINAAFLTIIVTFVVATFLFNLQLGASIGAIGEGIYQGILPIAYIIIMALWLYKLTNESGQFNIIEDSIAGISQDQRIQLLLIGFCFNAFLEGAAGFGVPIAICAVLLVQLGFKPLQAATYCLVANGAAGAYGAIGIPVGIIDSLTLQGDITAMEVSQTSAYIIPILSFIIPFLLIFMIDGMKGIRETFIHTLVVSIVFSGLQTLIITTIGPEIADIIPSLAAMVALGVVSKFKQPTNIYRLNESETKQVASHSLSKIAYAWSPFIILTALVILWSSSFFQSLFKDGGLLEHAVFTFTIPGSYNEVNNGEIPLTLNIIGQTGTPILLSALITILIASRLKLQNSFKLLLNTIKELMIPIITICLILGIAKLTTYSGMTNVMGEGLAVVGQIFPLFAPILGWIGVFMTGSVVNNNTLFAPIQASVAHQIGASGPLLVAANTAGGVTAKLISPQSVAIATAAVGKVGEESKLIKMALKYSVILLIIVCILTYVLSLLLN